jgi:filamentous hemagglutinin family protein
MNRNSGNAAWQSIFLNSLAVSGILIFSHNQALAQVTPDDTLGNESSVVNTRDANSDSIDGGAIRGQNLFHSFQEFNVDAGRGVYFANPEAVTNIFSRVTGNDVSDILGTLGVDGAANLFLINPNGIIFGEGASLDVNGSFAATTASGIEFGEQGSFDAINPQISQLLTINPSAYLFNQIEEQAVGDIESQADLAVPQGENLVFLGGDIELTGSAIKAPGGRIELGSLQDMGEVGISDNGNLTFPNDLIRGNIFLIDTFVEVTSLGGGFIDVDARNLELENTVLGAGIGSGLGKPDTVAGDIIVNLTEKLRLNDSVIANALFEEGQGKIGNVKIFANSVMVTNEGLIGSSIVGRGNAGDVFITTSSLEVSNEALISTNIFGKGNAGDVFVTTDSLEVSNGAQISASTFGKGNAGDVFINATDSILFGGEGSQNNPSGAFSAVVSEAEGDGGNVSIITGSLKVNDGARISASTFGKGNAGDLFITSDSVIFDGVSAAFSKVESEAEGNAGKVEITTNSLQVLNGAQISSSTLGQGDAGSVTINASDSVIFDGESSNGINSGANSQVNPEAEGNAGEVEITTNSLQVLNGAQISSGTLGQGDAGSVTINASDSVVFDGVGSDGNPSNVSSQVDSEAEGNAGEVEITTSSLQVLNGAQISSSTLGQGQGGELTVNVNSLKLDNNAVIASLSSTSFEAGNINLNIANSLQATDSEISTNSIQSSGGNLTISAGDIQLRGNSDIRTDINSGSEGGGDINLTADSIVNRRTKQVEFRKLGAEGKP